MRPQWDTAGCPHDLLCRCEASGHVTAGSPHQYCGRERPAVVRCLDRVGVPRLETGIDGLAWPDVETVLWEAAAGSSVTLVVMSRAQVRR